MTGSTMLAALKELGGLEFLQRVARGELPNLAIGTPLNFALASVEKGHVTFSGIPDASHYNFIETVHGGYAATLLDTAMACAILSTLPPGQTFTTLEFKINFVRGMTHETGRVAAEGNIIHAGKRIATADGRLVDRNGKLLAHGSTTCMVLDP